MFDGELVDVEESLYSAGGDLVITGKGSVSIETEFSTITFNDVFIVPNLKTNLLTLQELGAKGSKYEYIGGNRYLTRGKEKLAKVTIKNKLLMVRVFIKINPTNMYR